MRKVDGLIVNETYTRFFFPRIEHLIKVTLEVGVVNLIAWAKDFYQVLLSIDRNAHLRI